MLTAPAGCVASSAGAVHRHALHGAGAWGFLPNKQRVFGCFSVRRNGRKIASVGTLAQLAAEECEIIAISDVRVVK